MIIDCYMVCVLYEQLYKNIAIALSDVKMTVREKGIQNGLCGEMTRNITSPPPLLQLSPLS